MSSPILPRSSLSNQQMIIAKSDNNIIDKDDYNFKDDDNDDPIDDTDNDNDDFIDDDDNTDGILPPDMTAYPTGDSSEASYNNGTP
eukprot:9940329-Ditylum_brightwellii.AAC.1